MGRIHGLWLWPLQGPIVPESREVSTDLTQAVIGGLLPNSQYTFRVRAINSAGSGPRSEPSDVVLTTPGPPSPPGAPTQVESSFTSVTLAWQPPTNDGGSPVLRYFVRGSKD